MKAVYINRYGGSDEFVVGEVPEPDIRKNQVLVEVHATSVNPVDWKVRSGALKFLSGRKFPKILGSDLAGLVTKVGAEVTRFKPGDPVFGAVGVMAGANGANAEYVAVPEKDLALKPEGLSFEEAAALPVAGTTAYHNLKGLNIQKGDRVLVNGASGGVGIFALQTAKLLGAEVTGVCSGRNAEFVRSLGAEYTIDYSKEDFTKSDIRYRFIFDAYGMLRFGSVKGALTDEGVMLSTLPSPNVFFHFAVTKVFGGRKVLLANANFAEENLQTLASWVVEKKLRVHIDKTYTLDELGAAYDQSEKGGGKGKLVIKVR